MFDVSIFYSMSCLGTCEVLKSSRALFEQTKPMAVVRSILSLLIFPTITSAGESCRNVYSQSVYALVDHAYKSFFTGRLASCYMSCNTQPTCQSLNYNPVDKTCELNNDTKYFRPTYFVKNPEFVYAENPDSGKFFLIHETWITQYASISFVLQLYLWFLLIHYIAGVAFRELNP